MYQTKQFAPGYSLIPGADLPVGLFQVDTRQTRHGYVIDVSPWVEAAFLQVRRQFVFNLVEPELNKI